MTEANKVADVTPTDTPANEVDGVQPTLDELKQDLADARAETARLRGIRKTLETERNALKVKVKTPEGNDEDYKKLWEASNTKLTSMQDAVKSRDIKDALRTKLTTSKVQADKIDAAVALADLKLVEWNEDEGVSSSSVTAAVQKLKGSYSWLFETRVAGTPDAKVATEGNSSEKTITRAEFDRLSPQAKHDKIVKDQFKVVD